MMNYSIFQSEVLKNLAEAKLTMETAIGNAKDKVDEVPDAEDHKESKGLIDKMIEYVKAYIEMIEDEKLK